MDNNKSTDRIGALTANITRSRAIIESIYAVLGGDKRIEGMDNTTASQLWRFEVNLDQINKDVHLLRRQVILPINSVPAAAVLAGILEGCKQRPRLKGKHRRRGRCGE